MLPPIRIEEMHRAVGAEQGKETVVARRGRQRGVELKPGDLAPRELDVHDGNKRAPDRGGRSRWDGSLEHGHSISR